MPTRIRLLLLASGGLLLGGCGEMQPAVPLDRSIPLAGLMVALAGTPALLTARWLGRRWRGLVEPESGWRLPVWPVRRTIVIAVVAAVVVAAPLVALAVFLVGFSFAEAHEDVFTYADVVAVSAFVLAVAAIAWCSLLGIAGGLCSPAAATRRRVRVAVWVAVVLSAPLLRFGVPIAPVLAALLLSSRTIAPEPVFAEVSGRPPVGASR